MTAARKRPRAIIVYRRKQPAPLPPLNAPLDAVVLCIDSAKRSGWAIYVRGVLYAYGECGDRQTDRARVVADAVSVAYRYAIPTAMVLEVPWGGYSAAVVVSLTRSAEAWRIAWSLAGQDAARCIERTASDWRKRLFGTRKMPREQARVLEGAYARQVVLKVRGPDHTPIGGDAAAAICIGQVIITARELLAVLGCRVVARERQL